MNAPQTQNRLRRLAVSMAIAILVSLVVLIAMPETASAHSWAIGKNAQRVEAEVIDFNGRQILFRTSGNEEVIVNITQLNSDDLEYFGKLLETQQTINEQQIARQQLQQQRLAQLSRYYDQWQVELIAPNGERLAQNYLARSNIEAAEYGVADYPNARVGYVKKVRRRNFSY